MAEEEKASITLEFDKKDEAELILTLIQIKLFDAQAPESLKILIDSINVSGESIREFYYKCVNAIEVIEEKSKKIYDFLKERRKDYLLVAKTSYEEFSKSDLGNQIQKMLMHHQVSQLLKEKNYSLEIKVLQGFLSNFIVTLSEKLCEAFSKSLNENLSKMIALESILNGELDVAFKEVKNGVEIKDLESNKSVLIEMFRPVETQNNPDVITLKKVNSKECEKILQGGGKLYSYIQQEGMITEQQMIKVNKPNFTGEYLSIKGYENVFIINNQLRLPDREVPQYFIPKEELDQNIITGYSKPKKKKTNYPDIQIYQGQESKPEPEKIDKHKQAVSELYQQLDDAFKNFLKTSIESATGNFKAYRNLVVVQLFEFIDKLYPDLKKFSKATICGMIGAQLGLLETEEEFINAKNTQVYTKYLRDSVNNILRARDRS